MHDMHHMPENDHEAAMARADLYKLAQYSAKLFKMIQEGQQLEGWVQAKITKAADYVASVYHFMAYEMKVSEYGEALENAEVYESELREKLQQRLMEAKEKVKALKKVDAMKHKKHKSDKELEEMSEGWDDMMKAVKDRSGPQPSGGSGVKKGRAYGGSAQKDIKEPEEKKTKKVKEGAKPDFLDMDKDGNKKEPMKKAVADKKKNPFAKKTNEALKGGQKKLDVDKDGKLEKSDFAKLRASKGVKEGMKTCNESPAGKMCPVHGLKECGAMEEGSTGDYSAKKAAAGKDIGKPGKQFAKIASKAGKAYGSKERGEKVAGAVLAKLRKGE